MRIFSSERKESSGERGDTERDLSFETAGAPRPRPEPRSVVMMGGGLVPSRDGCLGGLVPNVATELMFGVSFTIGEY